MNNPSGYHEEFMRLALELSMQGRVTAPPNPWVGSIIVNRGNIVGRGFHRAPGEPHAEINALREAKDHASGATVYITLEPCPHFGRTPPCTKALIDAKVAKVVIGIQDPDPRVRGKGISTLKEAGIEVITDVCADEISKTLAPYLYHRRTGLPYCVAKGAVSIDGKVAAADGSSQWITSEEARQDSHQLRAESQAILIGARTAALDQPQLTVRNASQSPLVPTLRVIFDSKGTVLSHGPLFDTSLVPTLIVTTSDCSEKILQQWTDKGVDTVTVPRAANGRGVDLKQSLKILGSKGILQLLIEGGGTLLGSFLEENLIQRFALYVGPCILGNKGIPLFYSNAIATMSDAPKLNFLGAKTFGSSVRIDYEGVMNAGLF